MPFQSNSDGYIRSFVAEISHREIHKILILFYSWLQITDSALQFKANCKFKEINLFWTQLTCIDEKGVLNPGIVVFVLFPMARLLC